MSILLMVHVFKSNKLLIRMELLNGNQLPCDTYYLAYLFLSEGAKPLFLCKEKNEPGTLVTLHLLEPNKRCSRSNPFRNKRETPKIWAL